MPKYLTPYQIADIAERKATSDRAQTIAINRMFRAQDDSHLAPVRNRYNVTERAIRVVRREMYEQGMPCAGLEYCLALDSAMSTIVNSEY